MSARNISLIFLCAGILLVFRIILFFTASNPYKEGEIVSFVSKIQNVPKLGFSYQQISFIAPNHQRGFVRLPQEPTISYGDKIQLSGAISYIETKSGNKLLTLNYPKFQIIGRDEGLLISLRQKMISFFQSSLSKNNSALMLGIVFGIKQDFSSNFASNIQKTGLLHVIAASGMNITMIGGFFAAIFSYFIRRKIAITLTIMVIVFYAGLAGFEPSIIRASIMGILVFTAQILGRQSVSFLALFFAGFFMLMVDPSLLTDAGFQLSFLATFGLIFLRPIFYSFARLKAVAEKSMIGEDFLTTTTAQIFTLPILLIGFGSYSPISIFANMLVLWAVPILMIIGATGAVFGFIFEPLGSLVLAISVPLLEFFASVVNFFAQRSSLFTLENLPVSIVLGYYCILISILIWFGKREK